VELREAVLATRDLQLVYEAEQADASPVAIVREFHGIGTISRKA